MHFLWTTCSVILVIFCEKSDTVYFFVNNGSGKGITAFVKTELTRMVCTFVIRVGICLLMFYWLKTKSHVFVCVAIITISC